jgi:L-fuculose-phosphate aldolase
MDFQKEREKVAALMRRVYDRGLTTTLGGNISCRANEEIIAITPSGIDKGTIQPEQIGLVTLDGENKTPELKTSVETAMHLAVLKARPDVKFVLHAHPTVASTFACSDKDIDGELLMETRMMFTTIAKVGFALMGTTELADLVAEGVQKADCVLLGNHGVLTVGDTETVALERLEALETSAKRTIIMGLIGERQPLTKQQLQAIDTAMGR